MPYPRYSGGQDRRNNDHHHHVNSSRRDDGNMNPWQAGGFQPGRMGGGGGGGGLGGGGLGGGLGGGNLGSGLLPTPGQRGIGTIGDLSQTALAANILGTLLNASGAAGGLASSLAALQASGAGVSHGGLGLGGGPPGLVSPFNQQGGIIGGSARFGDSRGLGRDVRNNRSRGSNGGGGGGRDRSPVRRNNHGRGARSRSRSPRRNNRGGNDNNQQQHDRQRRPFKRGRDNASPQRERPTHEIYIGNYPVKFKEQDVRKLFEDYGIKVSTIRLKHDGLKAFAFAETISQEEVQKAVKSMESVEISGRRLRVRSAADKDKRNPNNSNVQPPLEKKPKRELTVDDVSRHLAYSFVGFLNRQQTKLEGADKTTEENLEKAKQCLRAAFKLPEEDDDESLKISRKLEVIFMQNNKKEIKVPSLLVDNGEGTSGIAKDAVYAKEDNRQSTAKTEGMKKNEPANNPASSNDADDDEGNWKRKKRGSDDEDDNEEVASEFNDEENEDLVEEDEDDDNEGAEFHDADVASGDGDQADNADLEDEDVRNVLEGDDEDAENMIQADRDGAETTQVEDVPIKTEIKDEQLDPEGAENVDGLDDKEEQDTEGLASKTQDVVIKAELVEDEDESTSTVKQSPQRLAGAAPVRGRGGNSRARRARGRN